MQGGKAVSEKKKQPHKFSRKQGSGAQWSRADTNMEVSGFTTRCPDVALTLLLDTDALIGLRS